MSDQTVDELRGHLNQVIHNLQPYALSSAALKLRRASHIPKREREATLNAQFHQAAMRLLETFWGGDLKRR